MWWSVADFKGLREGGLELSPGVLTILAGANSTGKSSLIQSILLAAQSVSHNGPIVLNGPLVRLGESKDLVRKGSRSTQITLRLDQKNIPGWDESEDSSGTPEGDITATIELRADPLNGEVSIQGLKIESDQFPGLPLYATKENRRTSDVEQVLAIEESSGIDILHLKSVLGSGERVLRTYIVFQGLVPQSLYQLSVRSKISKEYSSALIAIAKRQVRKKQIRPSSLRSPMAAYTAEKEVADLARSVLSSRELQGLAGEGKLRKEGVFGPDLINRLANLDDAVLSDYANRIAAERAKSPHKRLTLRSYGGVRGGLPPWWQFGLLEQGLFEHFQESMRAIYEFAATIDDVADGVNYLGPLRDEPRVIWSHWNEQGWGLPVGARGELSAAVLARRGQRKVAYHTPEGSPLEASLISAVNDWVAYLEIGEEVNVQNKGKLGVGLELAVAGEMRDLTAVGVGVSQALPLIVAMLSVPHGSTFIVEQPELHLHPAVQARLADFFSIARPDLSIVVETHSEAFLTRLRRRVAERKISPSSVKIIFVEARDGGSSTRELKLDQFGDLSEWPSGFLMAADDTAAILKANVLQLKSGGRDS